MLGASFSCGICGNSVHIGRFSCLSRFFLIISSFLSLFGIVNCFFFVFSQLLYGIVSSAVLAT